MNEVPNEQSSLEQPKKPELTIEEANEFFSKFYYGEHHIPSRIKSWGSGFYVEHSTPMSTFDFSELTRFIVMCHDCCIRGQIQPSSPRSMKVIIHKRNRKVGGQIFIHPSLEENVERLRKTF